MRASDDTRPRGLVDELLRSHRFTAVAVFVMLATSLLTSGYLILVSQPRLTMDIEMAREARDAHEAMLDQETGLRGWLATGSADFLEPYRAGRLAANQALDELVADVEESPEATRLVLDLLLRSSEWQEWAARAAVKTFTPRQRGNGDLEVFLDEGKRRFDAYRSAERASTELLKNRREAALSHQTTALVAVFLSYLLVLLVTGVALLRRRRQLRRTLLVPIGGLLATIGALHRGDLSARSTPTRVPELDEIGAELDRLADALAVARDDAVAREERLELLASRFETVVRVGREIAGSLSVRYVASTVTSAAAGLLGVPTVLWVRGDSQEFQAVHRSQDPHGAVPPPHLVAPPVVAEAAAEARPVRARGVRAYPLVLAGMVTGVLEVAGPATEGDADTEQVLDALLSTAATALESAHLHSSARELADVDGLTHLPNRRRFEVDVDTEWERCRRYGRPLSLAMVDLDHFKQLNDRHGHLVGDEVLRGVANALTTVLRTSDTAYRYGGEEIVVLLRETGLEDAAEAAERMRAAVTEVVIAAHPQVLVSASAGVATRHAGMAHHTELIEQADRALYEAKRLGRNRVFASGVEPVPAIRRLLGGGSAGNGEPATALSPVPDGGTGAGRR